MGNEIPRDLGAEHLDETRRMLVDYKENRVLIDGGEAPEGTPGLQAAQRLSHAAQKGNTYEDIDSSPEEIEALFGPEMKEAFDKNQQQ